MATLRGAFERLAAHGGLPPAVLLAGAVALAAFGACAGVPTAHAASISGSGAASTAVALAPPMSVAAAATSTPAPAPTSTVPPMVPTASRVAAATKWAKTRRGVVAFAVVDSSGKLSGYHMNTRFATASVVKAMLLVGYLRTHPKLSPWAKSTLTRMIHVSDNNAATAIYKIVGDAGLRKVAKAARMTHFSVAYSWGRAQLTPADQARFFYRMDSLLPSKYRTFARYQLSHITAAQSWGIPAAARPRHWTVFFKGGWRGSRRAEPPSPSRS